MRLKPKHSRFIASKIARDLANTPFITLPKGVDRVAEVAKMVIDENLEKERKLDTKVKELMEANEEEIAIQHVKERELFFMIKKRLASDYGVIMDYDERYTEVSYNILNELYEEYLIDYDVNDNQVRNIIFKSFRDFAKSYDEIDDIVYDKIRGMKKEYIPGTIEYDLLYDKLYEEELIRRGMI